MTLDINKQKLVQAMNQPGFENWESPWPDKRYERPRHRPENLPGVGNVGAVMLLLYQRQQPQATYSVLTKRRADLNHHAGQISLPGGRQDRGESLVETALRETHEEIGIDISRVEVIGRLNTVYVPPSDFTIYPFVGWHGGPVKFQVAEQEVEEIIEFPINDFIKPGVLNYGTIESDRQRIKSIYFRIAGFQVWGATAVVINEFLERIRMPNSGNIES